MKRTNALVGNELKKSLFSKKIKVEQYDLILQQASKVYNFSTLKEFLSSLKILKVRINSDTSDLKPKWFSFTINEKAFCTITTKDLYTYEKYDMRFYEFIDKLSLKIMGMVFDYSKELNLEILSDPNSIITPKYLPSHFLACLAGYRFY